MFQKSENNNLVIEKCYWHFLWTTIWMVQPQIMRGTANIHMYICTMYFFPRHVRIIAASVVFFYNNFVKILNSILRIWHSNIRLVLIKRFYLYRHKQFTKAAGKFTLSPFKLGQEGTEQKLQITIKYCICKEYVKMLTNKRNTRLNLSRLSPLNIIDCHSYYVCILMFPTFVSVHTNYFKHTIHR